MNCPNEPKRSECCLAEVKILGNYPQCWKCGKPCVVMSAKTGVERMVRCLNCGGTGELDARDAENHPFKVPCPACVIAEPVPKELEAKQGIRLPYYPFTALDAETLSTLKQYWETEANRQHLGIVKALKAELDKELSGEIWAKVEAIFAKYLKEE